MFKHKPLTLSLLVDIFNSMDSIFDEHLFLKNNV